tara:strand:- start:3387 stop:4475 length:1089 start_codon:yes stop_codon:yes gene_type:complete
MTSKVDIARRGILGLKNLLEEAPTGNLPSVRKSPLNSAPLSTGPDIPQPDNLPTDAILNAVADKVNNYSPTRRQFLKQAGSAALPMPKLPLGQLGEVIPELAQAATRKKLPLGTGLKNFVFNVGDHPSGAPSKKELSEDANSIIEAHFGQEEQISALDDTLARLSNDEINYLSMLTQTKDDAPIFKKMLQKKSPVTRDDIMELTWAEDNIEDMHDDLLEWYPDTFENPFETLRKKVQSGEFSEEELVKVQKFIPEYYEWLDKKHHDEYLKYIEGKDIKPAFRETGLLKESGKNENEYFPMLDQSASNLRSNLEEGGKAVPQKAYSEIKNEMRKAGLTKDTVEDLKDDVDLELRKLLGPLVKQ